MRCSAMTIQRFASASRATSSAGLHAAWPDGFLVRCHGKETLTGEETGRSGGEGWDSSERQKNLSFGATAQELLRLRETLLWPSKGSRHDKLKQFSSKLRTPPDSTEHERTNYGFLAVEYDDGDLDLGRFDASAEHFHTHDEVNPVVKISGKEPGEIIRMLSAKAPSSCRPWEKGNKAPSSWNSVFSENVSRPVCAVAHLRGQLALTRRRRVDQARPRNEWQ